MKRAVLRNIFTDDSLTHDKKFKIIENQIQVVEKNLPNLKAKVSEYSNRKSAENKCMDKIVTLLSQYATAENVSCSLKTGVDQFAQVLNQLNHHLEAFVAGFEENVVEDLGEFKVRSQHLRDDLKSAVTAAEHEKIRQRQLQRTQLLQDQDNQRVSAAEAELLKAKGEHNKAIKSLNEHADIFEQKKLMGLKSALLAWASLELRYHARALELFTDAYRVADGIDVEADLERFRVGLQSNDTPPRLATVYATATQRIDAVLQNRSALDAILGGTPIRGYADAESSSSGGGGAPRPTSRMSNSTIGFLDDI